VLREKPKEVSTAALEGLRAIHSKGWLHGDVALRNVIVSRQGYSARIIDLESLTKMPTDRKTALAKQAEELNTLQQELDKQITGWETAHRRGAKKLLSM